ncbi:MAG TPA: hypothetical protein VLT91_08425 [Rhizomicrobium sp.]|nr:hypothetical protein [Rhizomicrobium sp.]
MKLLADADGEHDRDVREAPKKLKESLAFSGPVHAPVATYKNDRNWGLKEVGRF